MKSATKNLQNAATLRRVIARVFGEDAVPASDDFAEADSVGWFNAVYVLTLADGRRCVLKIAPPAGVAVNTREIGMMAIEVDVMRLIEERTDVPVPHVHHYDTAHDLIDADWFVMDYVDARNFADAYESGDLTPGQTADGKRQVGALNRKINEITGPGFGFLHRDLHPTWSAAFTAMMEEVIGDAVAADVDLGVSPRTLLDVVAARTDALDEVTVPRLTETDLWDKNTMWRDGRIVAVLDHERAIWGDPLMEGGFTGIDLPIFGEAEDFAAGYGKDLSALTEGELTRRHLYTLWVGVTVAAETGYRHYETDELLHVGRDITAQALAMLGDDVDGDGDADGGADAVADDEVAETASAAPEPADSH